MRFFLSLNLWRIYGHHILLNSFKKVISVRAWVTDQFLVEFYGSLEGQSQSFKWKFSMENRAAEMTTLRG